MANTVNTFPKNGRFVSEYILLTQIYQTREVFFPFVTYYILLTIYVKHDMYFPRFFFMVDI